MSEKLGRVRSLLSKVPLLGAAARWAWRLVTAPNRVVRLEQQNERMHEQLTQMTAQSAHAIRRTDERLAPLEEHLARIDQKLKSLLAAMLADASSRSLGDVEASERLARIEHEIRTLSSQWAAAVATKPASEEPVPEAARVRSAEEEAESREARERAARFENYVGQALGDLGREAVAAREKLTALEIRMKRPLLEVIRDLQMQVEPYQPLYECPAGPTETRRPCADRAETIERALDLDPHGMRVLDLGCSLGWFSFYFAERGAQVTGLDSNPTGVALARRVGEYNGIPTSFYVVDVTLDFVRGLSKSEFDVALVLSLLHHVIHEHGLDEAQSLVAELCERVPLVFVELATRREPVTHPWRESLPEDPMAVFARCEDVDIEKIGEFPTHLSAVPRPLYRLRRRSVSVNNVRYAVTRTTSFSYAGAESTGKTFLFGPDAFIKRLRLRTGAYAVENLRQALREIANHVNLRGRSARLPVLKDYALGSEEILIVFERLDAENLLDLFSQGEVPDVQTVFSGVLEALVDLRRHGLYHNDVRAWNVMLGRRSPETTGDAPLHKGTVPMLKRHDGTVPESGQSLQRGASPVLSAGPPEVTLIDLGHAEPEETDDTRAALLWLAHDLTTGQVTRDVGWPVKAPPAMTLDECHPVLRDVVGKLLDSPSFDEFLKRSSPATPGATP